MASPAKAAADFLILYAHPNPKSFCNGLLGAVVDGLKAAKKTYVVRDLYEMKWDTLLAPADFVAIQKGTQRPDVAKEQAFVKDCKQIIVIFPLWWFSVPAALKGWVDRVFSHGFAYGYDPKGNVCGLLGGRKVTIFTTAGSPKEYFEGADRMGESIETTIGKGIFRFVGLEVNPFVWMYGVPSSSAEQRKKWLAEAKDLALKL